MLGKLGHLAFLLAALLVVYYVWLFFGTNLVASRSQHQLRSEFLAQIPQTADSGSAPSRARPVPKIREGKPLAILVIPRIHLNMVTVQGTSRSDLQKGPGHYMKTAYPWEDQGRVAIAGHRTTYLHPFWSLDKLRPGDLVRLITAVGTFDYRVASVAEVDPSATWITKQTSRASLVLTTCTPRFSASRRLVVFAVRTDDLLRSRSP